MSKGFSAFLVVLFTMLLIIGAFIFAYNQFGIIGVIAVGIILVVLVLIHTR